MKKKLTDKETANYNSYMISKLKRKNEKLAKAIDEFIKKQKP